MPVLTVSGNEITNVTRTTNTQGDGLSIPGGYGIYEATTNSHLNGGMESNITGWNPNNGPEVLTRDTTFFKFGTASLKIVTAGSVTSEGTDYSSTAVGTAASGQTWTISAWVFIPNGATMIMQLVERNAANGLLAGGGTTNFTGTGVWQRVSCTATLSNASTSRLGMKIDTKTTAQAITFWVDGAQIEQKPNPTAYVETNGSAASRTAARVQAPNTLLTPTQGWIAARVRMGYSSSAGIASRLAWYAVDSTGTNRISCSWNAAGNVQIENNNGTTTQTLADLASSWTANDVMTVFYAWTSTTIYVSRDGVTPRTLARNGVPTGTFAIDIGSNTGTNQFMDSSILWLAMGTGTISTADVTTLNKFSNTPPTYNALQTLNSFQATPTVAWNPNNAYYAISPNQLSAIGVG